MNNKLLEETERTVRAALDTVNYQIRELKRYYSREQVRCWYVQRRKLKAHLAHIEMEKKKPENPAAKNSLRSGRVSQTTNQQI